MLGLQRAAGNRAVASRIASGRLQRKVYAYAADQAATPAGLIKSAFNVNAVDQTLTGKQPLGAIDRPREVKAIIDAGTLRSAERKKDPKLSVVTSLARTEELLLQGADLKKFYDAGHLVGDQLIGGGGANSFEYWNLAPQVSEFNTPEYSKIEAAIRALIGVSAAHVHIHVKLDYPPDYTVTAADLVKRRVIRPGNYGDPKRTITVPRRIPQLWTLQAITMATTPSAAAPAAASALPDPTLGKPFAVTVVPYIAAVRMTGSTVDVNMPAQQLQARQWVPSANVRQEDIIGLLAKTFPDLGGPADIIKRLVPTGDVIVADAQVQLMKRAAGDVALSMLKAQALLLKARDTHALQPLFAVIPAVTDALAAAQEPTASLADAAAQLITANSWIDDLLEELGPAVEEQERQHPFTFFQTLAFQAPTHHAMERFEFSQSQLAPDYVPATEDEEMEIETRQSLPHARDVTTDFGITDVVDTGKGTGSLIWQKFGFDPPAKAGEAIVIMSGTERVTVIVQGGEMFSGGGRWRITWKHPGH